jgi:excisionase family DNA binding protein
MANHRELVLATDAAEELGVTKERVYNLIRAGSIEGFKIEGNKRTYVARADVELMKAYLAETGRGKFGGR